jgi:hypothetical protein
MDDDQKKLDSVKPLEFTWSSDGANMSSGFIAQEIDIANITTTNYGAAGPVYTIDSVGTDTIDLSGITIGGSSGGNFSFTSSMPTNSISGVNEINTANGKRIDLEELADVVETIKKRLLILAPNFELHEKYPMLKELYDEYKALEKLLGGPDRKLDEDL